MEKHAINYSRLLKGITDIKVTFLESNFFKKANGVRPIFFIYIYRTNIYLHILSYIYIYFLYLDLYF